MNILHLLEIFHTTNAYRPLNKKEKKKSESLLAVYESGLNVGTICYFIINSEHYAYKKNNFKIVK